MLTTVTKAPDDLLGRDFIFRRALEVGTTVDTLTLVGLDPERGVWLVGTGFDGAWVDPVTFRRLLNAGVLEAA